MLTLRDGSGRMTKPPNYTWMTDDQYKKALFHLRSQIDGIMNTFRCYGMQEDVNSAVSELVKIAELFSMVTRGKDIPIEVIKEPRRRITD